MIDSIFIADVRDANQIKSKEAQFKSKYAGVKCVALHNNTDKLDDEETRIDADSKMNEIEKRADDYIAGHNNH